MKAKKEELANKPASEQSELEEAKAIIAEQNALINELQAQAQAAPAKNIVSIDGLQYEVKSGGKIKGKTMTAEEIAADMDLVVLLIKLKSNLVCALN